MELQIERLCKTYGRTQALRNFSCTLTPGVYGLLGPNGAGKSTLLNILSRNLAPTSGRVLLDGAEIGSLGTSYLARVGFMPQQQALYPGFTCRDFLGYCAALREMKRQEASTAVTTVMEQVELAEKAGTRISALSGGMKQRLLLAQALLGDADLLLLDEPTAGLDPRQRIAVRNLISSVAVKKIVLICTHVVQDVEAVAKQILILKKGVLIEQNTPAEMLNGLRGGVWEVVVPANSLPEVETHYPVSAVLPEAEGMLRVRVVTEEPIGEPAQPTLEDVYLYHFGGEA